MSKVSKDTTETVVEFPAAIDRSTDVDGYTIEFVTIKQDHSLAPMLATLPGGHCSCPHWGYLFTGQMTVHYGDHDDVFEAGDAFYMPPGHVPDATAGTEFVLFSPADLLAATNAAVMKGMQAANSAG